jgi:hypothetical protein
MFQDERDQWSDALFWGVTFVLALLAVLSVMVVQFSWWVPIGR